MHVAPVAPPQARPSDPTWPHVRQLPVPASIAPTPTQTWFEPGQPPFPLPFGSHEQAAVLPAVGQEVRSWTHSCRGESPAGQLKHESFTATDSGLHAEQSDTHCPFELITVVLYGQKFVPTAQVAQLRSAMHVFPQHAPLQLDAVQVPPASTAASLVDPPPSALASAPESPPEPLPPSDPELLPPSDPESPPPPLDDPDPPLLDESLVADVSALASVEASSGIVASFPVDASTGTVESTMPPSLTVPEELPDELPEEPLDEPPEPSPPPSFDATNSVPPLPVPHPAPATAVPHPTSTSAIRLFRFIGLQPTRLGP